MKLVSAKTPEWIITRVSGRCKCRWCKIKGKHPYFIGIWFLCFSFVKACCSVLRERFIFNFIKGGVE